MRLVYTLITKDDKTCAHAVSVFYSHEALIFYSQSNGQLSAMTRLACLQLIDVDVTRIIGQLLDHRKREPNLVALMSVAGMELFCHSDEPYQILAKAALHARNKKLCECLL